MPTMLSYNASATIGATTPKSPVHSLSSLPSSPKLAGNTAGSIASVASSASSTHPTTRPRLGECHHIWLVTGPAGCGKSTVAQHIADTLNLPYIEGDSVCPVLLSSPYAVTSCSFANSPVPPSCQH